MSLPFPQAVLSQHVIALGKTRAGKSSKLRLIVEHLLENEEPTCIIDPKGVVLIAPTPEQLAEAAKSLPRRLRDVFILANVLGMPRLEIAAVLGISVRRVERRMEKALKLCRDRTA